MAKSHGLNLMIALLVLGAVFGKETVQSNLLEVLKSATLGRFSDPADLEKKIANLVTMAVNNGTGHMNKNQIGLLEDVVDMFVNSSVPAIIAAHQSDTTQINENWMAITKCEMGKKDTNGGISGLREEETLVLDPLSEEADRLKDANIVCRGELEELEGLNKTHCEDFKGWLDEEKNGTGPSCPENMAKPSQAMKTWMLDNQQWFKQRHATYTAKEATCNTAEQNLLDKIPICTNLTMDESTAWCHYCKNVKRVNNKYDNCYENAAAEYMAGVNATQYAVQSRKIEYETIKRATCYLTILTEEALTSEALDKCKNLPVSTTFLDIDYPAARQKNVTEFQGCPDDSVNTCPWYVSPVATTSEPGAIVVTPLDKKLEEICADVAADKLLCQATLNFASCGGKTGSECCPVACQTTTTTTAAPTFLTITSGTCSSQGMSDVMGTADCQAQSGVPAWHVVTTESDASKPNGCIVASNNWLAVNTGGTGTCSTSLKCVCQAR